MKKKIALLSGALLALATPLYSHPGPPGHTHSEGSDWPFGNPYPVGMIILGIALAVLLVVKLKGSKSKQR